MTSANGDPSRVLIWLRATEDANRYPIPTLLGITPIGGRRPTRTNGGYSCAGSLHQLEPDVQYPGRPSGPPQM